MTDFLDLGSRTSKLQKEQQKRRDAARARLQREKLKKEAAAQDQARIEENIRQRKLEQRRREEEAIKQEEAEQARTGGIRYKESLLPVAADGEGDKVLLPPSALEALSSQDAVSMGPMLFELTLNSPGGRQQGGSALPALARIIATHAGVLEFVADEGTIGLPRKVILSLLGNTLQEGSDGTVVGENRSDTSGKQDDQEKKEEAKLLERLGRAVDVKYVRLAKAKFARVVPETVGLSQVSELRAMLEHNMRNHATLTVGDRLSVWRRGKEFSLKVVELRPEPQVTLIDTDMEIELDLPDEAREKLEEKGAKDRAKTLRAHMDVSPPSSAALVPAVAGTSTGRTLSPTFPAGDARVNRVASPFPMDEDEDSDLDSDEEETAATAKDVFNPEKHRQAMLEGLPAEPARDEEGVFTCQLRSSQGKFARRFRFGDGLGLLLDFAEAQGGLPGHYRVVVPYPRKVLTREEASAGMTLKEAGLTSKQEAVILEKF